MGNQYYAYCNELKQRITPPYPYLNKEGDIIGWNAEFPHLLAFAMFEKLVTEWCITLDDIYCEVDAEEKFCEKHGRRPDPSKKEVPHHYDDVTDELWEKYKKTIKKNR